MFIMLIFVNHNNSVGSICNILYTYTCYQSFFRNQHLWKNPLLLTF